MKSLRVIWVDENSTKFADKTVTTLEDLAHELIIADYGQWIEGLRYPICGYDIGHRHLLGKFIRDNLQENK